MNIFLLSVCCMSLLQGISIAHTTWRSWIKRDFLDKRATDELSLWLESGETSDGPDELFLPDSGDISFQAFNQASAVTCDDRQSSVFGDSLSSLDARNLRNEFLGASGGIVPRNGEICVPSQDQTSAPGAEGGQNLGADLNLDSFDIDLHVYDEPAGECDGLGVEYEWPLCCDGGLVGAIVYGCQPCKFFIPGRVSIALSIAGR